MSRQVADGEGAAPPAAMSPDRDAEPESLVVTLDTGDRIHYLDWGGPGETADDAGALPLLLLIHGLAQTAWAWAPVARRLRRHARVLAIDLRGHGLSEAPRTGYDAESLAFDVLTVLAANGSGADAGGAPAVVAGHGLGAIVAASTAALRPASVAAVALIDGGWEDIADATQQTPAEFLRGLAEPPEVLRTMEAYLADRRAYDPGTWDADQERAARAAVDEKYAGHVAQVARPHVIQAMVDTMFAHRPRELVAALDAPLFVAVAQPGGADDEDARQRLLELRELMARRESRGRDRDRVVVYPGAAHNLMRYRPDGLSAELLALLQSVASPYQRS